MEDKNYYKKATVTNIQRFSLHDGAGIRTIVFFKGCPLKCPWCSNPETQLKTKEVMQSKLECLLCKKCINSCPNKALYEYNHLILVNKSRCNLCGICQEVCPTSNIRIIGKDYSVEDLANELIKDKVFYKRTNGGVTYSGGEPTIYMDFLISLSKNLKNNNIHIAIETCGYFNFCDFKRLVPYIDLIFFDLKIINNQDHKNFIGKSNKLIISNLKRLVKFNAQKNIIIRFPLIPKYTDKINNIKSIIDIMHNINILKIEILPYHRLGESKYERLGKSYDLKGVLPSVNNFDLKKICNVFKKEGIEARVSG